MEPSITKIYICEQEVSDLLGVSIRTIQQWRKKGLMPLVIKITAKTILYQASAINLWISNKELESSAK